MSRRRFLERGIAFYVDGLGLRVKRRLTERWGVVGFVDAGQVYTDRVPSFRNLRAGVGIGARFYTNFGPLRVDVATPLGRRKGESRIALYISIGQAF